MEEKLRASLESSAVGDEAYRMKASVGSVVGDNKFEVGDDEYLYSLLVQHVHACSGQYLERADLEVSLQDSTVPVPLAAVLAIFHLAPHVSPVLGVAGEAKVLVNDIETLLEFWNSLFGTKKESLSWKMDEGDGNGVMEIVKECTRTMLSTTTAQSTEESKRGMLLLEECSKYLLFTTILRLINLSTSTGKVPSEVSTCFGVWQNPSTGAPLSEICFTDFELGKGVISAKGTSPQGGRMEVGDRIRSTSNSTRTGKVIRDDHSSNPYIVQWDDGTESGWLYPHEIEGNPDDVKLTGAIKGNQVTLALSCNGDIDHPNHYVGKFVKEGENVAIYGTLNEEHVTEDACPESKKGQFRIDLGSATNHGQNLSDFVRSLYDDETQSMISKFITPFQEKVGQRIEKVAATCISSQRPDITMLKGRLQRRDDLKKSDKMLLNLISTESPEIWGGVFRADISFVTLLMQEALSADKDSSASHTIRLSLSNVIPWLASGWHEASSGGEAGEGDAFFQETSAGVLSCFTQTLCDLVSEAERDVEKKTRLKIFLARKGMSGLMQSLCLLGYAILTRNKSSEPVHLLGMLASLASLLDRATTLTEACSKAAAGDALNLSAGAATAVDLRPMTEILLQKVGTKLMEIILAKRKNSLVDQHSALFGGASQLSDAHASGELLNGCEAKIDALMQPKIAVHMSPFLDDLERHTIIAILHHYGVLPPGSRERLR